MILSGIIRNSMLSFSSTVEWQLLFFVKANFTDLIKRDTKLLYKRAKEENFQVLGYNSKIKYELSNYKRNVINTSLLNKTECLHKIKKIIIK